MTVNGYDLGELIRDFSGSNFDLHFYGKLLIKISCGILMNLTTNFFVFKIKSKEQTWKQI